ncbi:MFS multidrug transporter [Colletotrichum scovillei]|uniref:MFS multidrug transporter n=1 Tax=Colletotrichum scovillei TaxID=1209932 RepID=A0A9P7QPI6_9PEZI|nr:MFS multidrug transporter [Colletotrichum scovillei]KAG7040610.1 MFS multidrug transporter [Colletotrichum scovillei]KAG7060657.1 MFS multidrug transporter [Colletotrichum scovillei]
MVATNGPIGLQPLTSGIRLHPRDRKPMAKAYDTCLILFLEFYTPLLATFAFVSRCVLRHDSLPLTDKCGSYLIGQSIGGVIFPPFSESFGRKNLYIISTGLFSLCCLVVAVSAATPSIIIGRFFTGLFSSIPTIVTTGSIEDLWDTRARVWWVFLWVLVANIGLLAGPIISDAVIGHARWNWVFYTAAIVTACVAVLLVTITESRPSVVLATTAANARRESQHQTLVTRLFGQREPFDVLRPLRLLFTEPIVFMVSITTAVSFGIIYLFTQVLPIVYHTSGLNGSPKNVQFLAIILGTLLSILTRGYDLCVLTRRSAQNLPITPENKLAGFLIGAPLLSISLWWFAWTIPPFAYLHWAIPTSALVLTGYALNEFNYVLAGYLTDCYEQYAASSVGAMAITRSVFSAAFPLLGKGLFQTLGFNLATTVLAAVASVLCIIPPLLLRYGRKFREKSVLARG